MKPVNFEKILFPLNALLTAAIFFMITPTTYIYTHWFPEKNDSLWLVPAVVMGVSAVIWFVTSLNMPRLIQKGIFEDRRKDSRPARVDVSRVAGMVANFLFHMIFLLLMCGLLVAEMRSGTPGRVLFSRNTVWHAS